jgi:hypothetical protein
MAPLGTFEDDAVGFHNEYDNDGDKTSIEHSVASVAKSLLPSRHEPKLSHFPKSRLHGTRLLAGCTVDAQKRLLRSKVTCGDAK